MRRKKRKKPGKQQFPSGLADEAERKGLYLLVDPGPAKLWRLYEKQTGREIGAWNPASGDLRLWGRDGFTKAIHAGEFIRAVVIRRSEMRADGVLPPRPENPLPPPNQNPITETTPES